jgi:hypothetical protein
MPENTQEATQQATNETSGQTAQEQAPVQAQEQQAPVQQEIQQQEVQQPAQPKRTHNDRITELESKLARMEALYQLNGLNVVDTEVCADLLMKGYTIDQLRKSKPYLFGQAPAQEPAPGQAPSTLGVVKQPPRVVAETQSPKAASIGASPDGFVKQLAEMLKSKF